MGFMKTSRDIKKALNGAMKRQSIQSNLMASDLGVSPQILSNHRHVKDATPEKAVMYSQYLRDYKLNNELAAIYFDAVSMFDPNKWAVKFRDDSTMTWLQLKATETQRLALGDKVFEFAVNDPKEWTKDENAMAYEWVIGLLRMISLSSLLAHQFSEIAGYDLDKITNQVNKEWGDM